jgi:hypothetical protein
MPINFEGEEDKSKLLRFLLRGPLLLLTAAFGCCRASPSFEIAIEGFSFGHFNRNFIAFRDFLLILLSMAALIGCLAPVRCNFARIPSCPPVTFACSCCSVILVINRYLIHLQFQESRIRDHHHRRLPPGHFLISDIQPVHFTILRKQIGFQKFPSRK